MPTEPLTYEQQLEQSMNEPFDYTKAMSDYNTGQKPILDAIMSNYKKPEQPIDPEQAQKAKFGAAMTDTLGSLAEMVAQGNGARIRNRTTPTSTQTTNARLKEIQDKYEKDLTQYQAVNGNAQMQDLNMFLANRREANGLKRQYLTYLAKKEHDDAVAKAAAAKYQDELNYKKGRDKVHDNQEETKIGIERAKANKEKTDKFAGLVINAHPSDNTAQTDATGARVIPYKMTKPEIDNMAMTAKNDQTKDENGKTFMDRHPELLIDKPDMFGTPHKGLTTDQEIANAYAQERYNSKFAKPQQAAPPAPVWKVPKFGGQQGTVKKISNF
jgi:hypothetical protein